MKKIAKHLRGHVIPVVTGSLLFGASVNMFLLPLGIVTGGATGLATAAGRLWGFPVGLTIILINLPIFALCIRRLGIDGMIYSIIGTCITSAAADLMTFLPRATDDPLIAAIFGGVTMGIGAGMLLTSGLTTGGTDLAAYLIHKKRPSLSTGKIIIFFDIAVITVSAAALGSFTGILYSAICTVGYSVAFDTVQSLSRRARIAFIISDRWDTLAPLISVQIDRGVTLIPGKGFYSGKDKQIIMCVTGRTQEFPLRRLVMETDPDAFIVISEATGVTGKGFGEIG